MLRFEIIENSRDFVSYRYFPEDQNAFGTISVSKEDKKIIDQEIASNDDFKWCFFKLFKRIKEFIDEGKYDKNGIIAWY